MFSQSSRAVWEEWLSPVMETAITAGKEIESYCHLPKACLNISRKADNTVLTQADMVAHHLIVDRLSQLTPEVPVLSEEGGPPPAFDIRQQWPLYWLVDPLDGTESFIQNSKEFTVNIALIENHSPVMGVIYDPVLRTCYFAVTSKGAFKQMEESPPVPLQTHPIEKNRLQILVGQYMSLKRLQGLVGYFPRSDVLRVNSSLKFCWLADNRADCYPGIGKSCEWDVASGHCILQEAGGAVVDLENRCMQYNVKESLRNSPFLAVGDQHIRKELVALLRDSISKRG